MKRLSLTAAGLYLLSAVSFSQTNTFPASGNVGIETLTPASKLQVASGKLYIGIPNNTDTYDLLYAAGSYPGFRQEVQRNSGGATFDMFNIYAHKRSATGDALWGKIGILGHFGTEGVDGAPTVSYMFFGTNPSVTYQDNTFRLYPNKVAYFDGKVGIGITSPVAKLDINGNVFSSGAIAIGTKDAAKIGTNMLAVNGSAIFTKAKVAVYGGTWPDYVFEDGYQKPGLDSLEKFIVINKRLPDVPAASIVEKEGIDLGQNQTVLLKKIEELTLYIIEQNKRTEELLHFATVQKEKMEKLQKITEGLNKENKELVQRMQDLENTIKLPENNP